MKDAPLIAKPFKPDFQLGCRRVPGEGDEQKGCSCKAVGHEPACYRRTAPVHSWSLGRLLA